MWFLVILIYITFIILTFHIISMLSPIDFEPAVVISLIPFVNVAFCVYFIIVELLILLNKYYKFLKDEDK